MSSKLLNFFLEINVYTWGQVLATVLIILFCFCYIKNFRIDSEKMLRLAITIVPFAYSAIFITGKLDNFGGFNWVRAVVVMPIALYLLCFAINMPFSKTMDFIAPCAALHPGIAHIFCIFPGCCYGYPCWFGIWNKKQHDYLFPVQLFEAATYLLIFWYMIHYAKKKNYKVHGISYAQYLFLFGLTRTFWEFFRDNTEVRWQISIFQYYSFAAFVVGAVWIITTFYIQKHPKFIERHDLLFREDVGELTKMRMFLSKRKRNI